MIITVVVVIIVAVIITIISITLIVITRRIIVVEGTLAVQAVTSPAAAVPPVPEPASKLRKIECHRYKITSIDDVRSQSGRFVSVALAFGG